MCSSSRAFQLKASYRKALSIGALVALLAATASSAGAEQAKRVVVTLVNQRFTPAQPVTNARIALTYFDGSEKVTDALERTNREGKAELVVSSDALERGNLRLEVSDAPGLLVYRPSEGRIDVLPSTLEVIMLPKGSPAFLEPAQIEAMLNRLSVMTLEIQEFIRQRKEETEKSSFDRALQRWAEEHGLPYPDVNERVKEWSADVIAHRNEASLTKQAEAELGLRHYEQAGVLFESAAEVSKAAMNRDREKFLIGLRRDLRDEVQLRSKSAAALQSARLFPSATKISVEAQEDAAAEHRRYPEDAVIRNIWLRSSILALYSRWKEGQQALAGADNSADSIRTFAGVIEEGKDLLRQIDRSQEPEFWSYVHYVLIVSTVYLSEVSDNVTAIKLRAEALEEAKSLVAAYDKRQKPIEWATGEMLVGLMLSAQAGRGVTDGKLPLAEANQLLVQGKETFDAMLQVITSENDLDLWIVAKSAIGAILSLQALIRTQIGKSSTELLDEAEKNYTEALKATNKAERPDDWNDLQNSLAGVLKNRAIAAGSSPEAKELWSKAEGAFRDSMEGLSKEKNPIQWANAEDELASILANEGSLYSGKEAVELLEKSNEAYQEVEAVFTRKSFPQRWARTEADRGFARAQQAFRGGPDQSASHLTDAVAAYKASLEIFTKEAYPQRWAEVEDHLAAALATQGVASTGEDAHKLMEEAAAAYSAALEVYPKDPGPLSGLGVVFHEYLGDFDQAYRVMKLLEEARPSDENQLNLAEAALTDGKFAECISVTSSLDESKMEKGFAVVRRTLLFACQWASGAIAPAKESAASIEQLAGLAKFRWTTKGDQLYLANAVEFRANLPLWLAVFQGLENGDGKALAQAVHSLRQTADK